MARVTNTDTTVEVVQGDSVTVTATFTQDDENGRPQKFAVDAVIHEVWLTVKDDPAVPDSQAWVRKRLSIVGDMQVRAAPKDNVVDVFIRSGETAILDVGRYFYDVQVRVNASGEKGTAVQGYFVVLPGTTSS